MLSRLTDALPLSTALREWFPVGRLGKAVHLSTGIRWIHAGVLSPSGKRVYLRAFKIGGQTYVRREDAEAFVAALNPELPVNDDSPADVERRANEACDALEKLGC